MPAKNKQQKNAFYWYMQELLPQLKREGRVFPNGMADVVPIAHPRYKVSHIFLWFSELFFLQQAVNRL